MHEHPILNHPPTLLKGFATALAGHADFPAAATDKATLCLQDFLACALATHHFPWVRQAFEVARTNSGQPGQTAAIVGTPFLVGPQDAAFANAVAGHSLVRDDMHVGSVSHLGVVVIPPVLALAARETVSGRQLLEAIICGYEAGARLGALLMDVETAKKLRPTGLIGAVAAAAAASRLCGLDATATANALGFASNYLTGLNAWAARGDDDMYFHPGIAARNGLTAMELARQGATSAPGSLDGAAGLFAALGKSLPESPALPFSGDPEILQVFFKQVPACNYAQTAAQAALGIRLVHGVEPTAIESVHIQVPRAATLYPGCDHPGPFSSILQARMSIHYNVAAVLLHGNFDDANYHDFDSAAIQALTARITLEEEASLTAAYPGRQGARVRVEVAGTSCEEALADVLSASTEEVGTRLQDIAETVLGVGRARELLACLQALPDSNGTSDITALLIQK